MSALEEPDARSFQREPAACARLARLESPVDSFPDPSELSDQQLVEVIDRLSHGEHETDYLRRVAERKVMILRAELIQRSGHSDDDPS